MGYVELWWARRCPAPVEHDRPVPSDHDVRRLKIHMEDAISAIEGGREVLWRGDLVQALVQLGQEPGEVRKSVRLTSSKIEQARALDPLELHVRALHSVDLWCWVPMGADVNHDRRFGSRVLASPISAKDAGGAQLEHISVSPPTEQASKLIHANGLSHTRSTRIDIVAADCVSPWCRRVRPKPVVGDTLSGTKATRHGTLLDTSSVRGVPSAAERAVIYATEIVLPLARSKHSAVRVR